MLPVPVRIHYSIFRASPSMGLNEQSSQVSLMGRYGVHRSGFLEFRRSRNLFGISFYVRGIPRNSVCEIPRMFGKKCTEFEANTSITWNSAIP
jgi:hypothetical protein